MGQGNGGKKGAATISSMVHCLLKCVGVKVIRIGGSGVSPGSTLEFAIQDMSLYSQFSFDTLDLCHSSPYV